MKETSGTVDMSCARLLSSSFAVVFNRKKKKTGEKPREKRQPRPLFSCAVWCNSSAVSGKITKARKKGGTAGRNGNQSTHQREENYTLIAT